MSDRPLVLPASEIRSPSSKPRGLLLQMPWLPRAAPPLPSFCLLSPWHFLFSSCRLQRAGHRPELERCESRRHPTNRLSIHFRQSIQPPNFMSAKPSPPIPLPAHRFPKTISAKFRSIPNSRVRLLQTDPNHKRLQLDVGTIHAAIWAPPGQFVVDTPSAVAVDLGCAYTLQVAPDGSGTIRTTLGWVGFHLNGRDSFIPAGAMCSTRPKVGPGTPYFEDATESFREALHTFRSIRIIVGRHFSALSTILSQARPRDGLTLWHLLSRTDGPERAQVYARFAALVPPPPGVTRDGILALDPHMLDLYWNALDLGDISSLALLGAILRSPRHSAAPANPHEKGILLKKSP